MENSTESQTEQPLNNATPVIPTPPEEIPSPVRSFKLIPIFLIIFLVLATGAAAYYFGSQGLLDNLFKKAVTNSDTSDTTQITPTISESPLFSGTLTKLDKNLKILILTEDDKMNSVVESEFTYYSAGIFTRGSLKDYTRIIALRPQLGPGSPLVYTLATKDFQTYILDDPEGKTTKIAEDNWENPYFFLDKTKITATQTFDTLLPKEITLGKGFSLYAQAFPFGTQNVGDRYITVLHTDFSSYQKLTSPDQNFTMYFAPRKFDLTNYNKMTDSQKLITDLQQKYLLGDTEVVVTDVTGLPYTYALTTPSSISSYKIKYAQYQTDLKDYETKSKQYQAKQITESPKYPDYVYLPNLGFSSSEIVTTKTDISFFKSYSAAVPNGCASNLNTRVVNLSDDELEQIGTVNSFPLFHLKDTGSSFYTLAYKNKTDYYDQDPSFWKEVNKDIEKPTLADYISKTPLLFIKDFWGRWIALGEYDINLPGGCGKPVVYLYPKKETKVSVSFQVPVQFTADIPSYKGSWEVLAKPNGELTNLKQQAEDCQLIDAARKGSEYAQKACQTNSYPYLYWAGNVTSVNYPEIKEGWFVAKNDLSTFIKEKLSFIGLNTKEISDFSEYWVPEMLSQKAPFYRISFLQNQDLNSLFPMTVKPQPDSVIRVFLDYQPLSGMPTTALTPQVLNHYTRHGFTLVEWGGKKI